MVTLLSRGLTLARPGSGSYSLIVVGLIQVLIRVRYRHIDHFIRHGHLLYYYGRKLEYFLDDRIVSGSGRLYGVGLYVRNIGGNPPCPCHADRRRISFNLPRSSALLRLLRGVYFTIFTFGLVSF